MSEQYIPNDLLRLPDIVEGEFGRALVDEIAPAIARAWQGRIIALDVIESRTYLNAVRLTEVHDVGEGLTATVEAPEAAGYAAAIKRRGESDYVGRRVAEEGIRAAGPDIEAALDHAGDRVKG